MKITFVLDYAGLSGGAKVVAIYARKLIERGHEVTVVSRPPQSPGLLRVAKSVLKGKGRPIRPGKTPYLETLGAGHVVLDRRRAVEDRDVPDADVVIATWWETAEWVAGLSPSKGRKFYLLQDYEVFPYLAVDRVIATYTLPLTKIAVSGYIRDALKQNHGVGDVTVVNNAVDLGRFNTPARSKSDIPTFGFLYQKRPNKNTGLALDVIRAAQDRFGKVRVIAFGKIPSHPDFPLPDWVEYHLRPEQSLIPSLYARCDAWLFTSSAEGFGLPILEAMACRTPVVGTWAGAAPDLIDGQNGFLVEPTTDAFLEKLAQIAAMESDTWQKYSRHAYETAQAHTWDAATDRLEQCLFG